MKAFANIKSRYAEYKALDSADKVKAWKEGLINNAIYLLIIIAVIYTYTQNSRFLSVASIVTLSRCLQRTFRSRVVLQERSYLPVQTFQPDVL